MENHGESRKRITINDIARISGYSKTAVSFAFNDPSRISSQAREVILAVAERLGYYPDPLARKFSLQKHETIGFLLPQDFHYSFHNPYVMRIIEGIGSECQRRGYNLTLIPPLNKSVTDAIRTAAVDAMIVHGMNNRMDIAKELSRRAMPFVTIDGIADEQVSAVNIDDRQAAADIMRTVLDSGHRKIAIITLPRVSYEETMLENIGDRRIAGCHEALEERGIDCDAPTITRITTDCTLEGGFHVADQVLLMPERPTCILVMSDIVAIGTTLRLASQGLRIPRDISIVGFDDIQESAYVVPALTSVHQPSFEKGRCAIELLFDLMRGQPSRQILLSSHLVIRDSLGPPPREI